MSEHLETLPLDTEVESVCEEIRATAEEAFALLLARREAAFAAAIELLETERANLAKEYAAITEASANLSKILPAQARTAQAQADALLLSGKADEAETRLQEVQEAAQAPAQCASGNGKFPRVSKASTKRRR